MLSLLHLKTRTLTGFTDEGYYEVRELTDWPDSATRGSQTAIPYFWVLCRDPYIAVTTTLLKFIP